MRLVGGPTAVLDHAGLRLLTERAAFAAAGIADRLVVPEPGASVSL